MRAPWKRTEDERQHDYLEAAEVQAKLEWAMSELRDTLDRVEDELEREFGDA